MRRRRILGYIGDISPVDHGGGVVFQSKYSDGSVFKELEYCDGAEGTELRSKLRVYQIDIPDDVLESHPWVEPEDIAGFTGEETEKFISDCKSEDILARAYCLTDIGHYYGFDNLDLHPIYCGYSELKRRWGQYRRKT